MFLTIRALYLKGQLTERGLNSAVSKGWITIDDKIAIMQKYEKVKNALGETSFALNLLVLILLSKAGWLRTAQLSLRINLITS